MRKTLAISTRSVISFLAGLFLAGAILTTSPSFAGILPPQALDINGVPYNGPTATPGGELRVSILSQLFTETFDTGYDTSQWTATTGGTGIAATSTVGNTILDGGTTLNSFSKLTSVPSFKPTQPGFLFFHTNLNLPSPVPSTAYTIWGLGTSPASPTIASPVTNCVCWEVGTNGVMAPVTYASGTRLAITPFATANQPKDSLSHKYFIYFKGDIAFWAIDDKDNVVANFQTGASGPDVNNLPVLFQIISNSGTHVTLQVNGITVGDTAHSTIGLSDSVYPWRRQTVYPSGAGFTGLVNTEGQRATYRYTVSAFTPVATPTAFAVIQGSATKVVRIKRISVGGVSTGGNMILLATRRSTAGTLGSAVLTAVTAAKHDNNDAAATAVVSTVGTANYTTMGTAVSQLAASRIWLPVSGTGQPAPTTYNMATNNDKPWVLRGATDFITLEGAGSAVPGSGVFDIEIETEEDTY